MVVTEVRDRWPEQQVRQREWIGVGEAIDRVEEAGLRDILRAMFGVDHPDRAAVA